MGDKNFQHLSHFERPNKIDLIHFLSRFLPISTHQNDQKTVHNINNIQIFTTIIFHK